MQTFLERLKNAVFYYGTKVGERWRALPMYISLGKENDVDCLSTEVSPSPLCRERTNLSIEWHQTDHLCIIRHSFWKEKQCNCLSQEVSPSPLCREQPIYQLSGTRLIVFAVYIRAFGRSSSAGCLITFSRPHSSAVRATPGCVAEPQCIYACKCYSTANIALLSGCIVRLI